MPTSIAGKLRPLYRGRHIMNPSNLAIVHTQAKDFWLARGAVAVIAGLQLMLINDLTWGPRWLAPALELTLLVPLSIATAWQQQKARGAETEAHWQAVARHRRAVRTAAVALTGLVSVMNFSALILLIRALLAGGTRSGSALLLDAINIWSINVIVFALWFWALDRGGPAVRSTELTRTADFLFPQLMAGQDKATFSPGFVDYLFVAFTNATAFSPTDTAPLSPRAKVLMMAEAAISLLTIALVAARAVNILS